MALPFVRRERHALCETALAVGPDAPTLCEGWTARDLVAHLLVREGSPAALGIVVPALAGLTERAMARAARTPYEEMVARLRDPGLTPFRLPPVERLANTVEYVVHHEDLRRAGPGWEPRALPPADLEALWQAFRPAARLSARRAGVPVVARRADFADLPQEDATLRPGPEPAVVEGPTTELALFFAGRAQTRGLTFSGPEEKVAALRAADLGG